jgi:type III secretion protein T
MEALAALGSLQGLALLVALSTTRIAVAFLLLPVFAPETVPATVRNAIFLSFGIVTLALQPLAAPPQWNVAQWIGLFAKEAMLGIGFGLLLGSLLWAFETAGQIVDAKVGATMAQVVDPLSGHQTSLSGAFLSRLATFLFMAGGGFMLFVGTLQQSFALWPVAQPGLALAPAGAAVFEAAFSHFALLSFLLAAPALLVLYVVDLALGLVNRFAPQINLISISMSLKAVAATVVWLLLFGVLVDSATERIGDAVRSLLPQMRSVIR